MSYQERLPGFNERQEETSARLLTDTIKRKSDNDHKILFIKQEAWDSFVLPKIQLMNNYGVKELFEDIRKDVWTVGEINGFGLSFDDLVTEKSSSYLSIDDRVVIRPIGYSLMVIKPEYHPEEEITWDTSCPGYRPEYISSKEYGFTVSLRTYSHSYEKKYKEDSSLEIEYENPKLQNGRLSEVLSRNSSPIEVQDAVVSMWEKVKHTLPFLIDFANEPIDKEVISAVKRGVKIPDNLKHVLESYR